MIGRSSNVQGVVYTGRGDRSIFADRVSRAGKNIVGNIICTSGA